MTDIPDGTYTAVVDRFEDDLAALELTDNDERYELVVEQAALPEDGRRVDAVFQLTIADGELADSEYDEAATARRSEAAQDRFDRLSKRPPTDEES